MAKDILEDARAECTVNRAGEPSWGNSPTIEARTTIGAKFCGSREDASANTNDKTPGASRRLAPGVLSFCMGRGHRSSIASWKPAAASRAAERVSSSPAWTFKATVASTALRTSGWS